jgi:hypothetical protein
MDRLLYDSERGFSTLARVPTFLNLFILLILIEPLLVFGASVAARSFLFPHQSPALVLGTEDVNR